MKLDEIKSQEDLKKYLAENEASHALVKAEEEKKAAAREAEVKAIQDELKASREKLAEVTAHNWVEKYSTKDVKEETLYNFGSFIKGVRTGNPELLQKYGSAFGGRRLSPSEENQYTAGEYHMQKSIPVEKTLLGTPLYGDATTGSYLVPVQYSSEVFYVAKQSSQMMGKVRELPMTTRTLLFPKQDTAATWYWNAAQSSAVSEVIPTFGQGTLTTYTGAIYTGVVDEMDEDSLVALAAYYRDIFGQAWGYEFDYSCTQANNASGNPFTGMLNGATNTLTLGAGQTTFDSMTWQDGYSVIQKLTTENKRTGAVWIMHATVLDNLRKLMDANGRPIWCTDQAMLRSQIGNGGLMGQGTLWGYPVLTTDGMVPNSSSAVSTKFMIFGNPQHFLYGNRVGAEFRVFDQTSYALIQQQTFFRMRLRAAFTTAVPGAFVAVSTSAS